MRVFRCFISIFSWNCVTKLKKKKNSKKSNITEYCWSGTTFNISTSFHIKKHYYFYGTSSHVFPQGHMTGSAQHVCRAETTQIKELKYSKTKKKITRHPYSSFGEKKSIQGRFEGESTCLACWLVMREQFVCHYTSRPPHPTNYHFRKVCLLWAAEAENS